MGPPCVLANAEMIVLYCNMVLLCVSVRSPQWLRAKWWSMKRHVRRYQDMTFQGLCQCTCLVFCFLFRESAPSYLCCKLASGNYCKSAFTSSFFWHAWVCLATNVDINLRNGSSLLVYATIVIQVSEY